MPPPVELRVADLLLDAENPRLSQPNQGQREVIRAMAAAAPEKIVNLARDIMVHRLDPSVNWIVVPTGDDLNRYVVLEANRRLTALRALENPDLLMGAVGPTVLKQLRELSRQYHEAPISNVTCVVLKDRDEAYHWIELKHTGENGGAGIVDWGSDESARFKARSGTLELHSQALDFLEAEGVLTPEARAKLPAASFKRLLGTPQVRDRLGIGMKDGKLMIRGKAKAVAKALMHVVHDLSGGKVATRHIYRKEDRIAYAEKLPASVAVDGVGTGRPAGTSDGKASAKAAKPLAPKVAGPRDVLIPRDCILVVKDRRVKEIEGELRQLSLRSYPNSVGVLLRVFIELSVDAAIEARTLSATVDDSLADKMRVVLEDLTSRQLLTHQQAAPVRRAMQKDSFLAPSIRKFHDYVHNRHAFPGPDDLRVAWNNLQPYITAMWPA